MITERRKFLEYALATEIRLALARTRMTQTELAQSTGLSQSQISKLLNNEQHFDITATLTLFQALNLDFAHIIPKIDKVTDPAPNAGTGSGPNNGGGNGMHEAAQTGLQRDVPADELPEILNVNGTLYRRL